jgi:hypothetical protein
MFAFFNERLFDRALPNVILTFSRRPRAGAFFAPRRWTARNDDQCVLGEIALNPDCLREYDPRYLTSIIVHEQVHCWQHASGHPGRRGYHNREWADRMAAIGLVPSHTGEPGGRRTGQRVAHFILDGGPFDRAYAEMPQTWMLPFTSGAPQSKHRGNDASKIKYSCPACRIAAWGTTGLAIECMKCRVPLVVADGASASPTETKTEPSDVAALVMRTKRAESFEPIPVRSGAFTAAQDGATTSRLPPEEVERLLIEAGVIPEP